MPLRIVHDFSDPNHTRRVVHVPDRADQPGRPRRGPRPSVTFRPRWPGDRPPPPELVVGLDLGQATDFTALAAVQRAGDGYEVPFLARTRGRPYPAIVESVEGLMQAEPFAGRSQLVIDATGVGRPVLDLFRAGPLTPVAVTITAGNRVTGGRRLIGVPKRDLVTALLVAFQHQRLRIAAGLEHAKTLTDELAAMRVRISATGHDSYGAWRDGEHDDLVLALALGVWWSERIAGRCTPVHDATPAEVVEEPPAPPRQPSNAELLASLDERERRR